MKKNNLKTAYMTATFGILAFIAAIVLIINGEPLIGISGAIVGAGLAVQSFKTIKEMKQE